MNSTLQFALPLLLSALLLSTAPTRLQATAVVFDSIATAGNVTDEGDQDAPNNLDDDWSFTTFADLPNAALGAGNSQIILELGGATRGTTIGMIDGSIGFTAGRDNSAVAEDLIALKPGDFGNSVTAFFRRTGDTYRAVVIHADGSVTDGGDIAGTPGTTTMGTNATGVGGIAGGSFYSADAGESQFAGLSNGDFAGWVRATATGFAHQIPGIAQASTLDNVQSVTPYLDTTIVESVVQASDDLNNNGDYSAADTFFVLEMAQDHTLISDYDVEHDGSAGLAIVDGNKVSGTLSAGTRVNAFLLRHDSDSDDLDEVEMSITFDSAILGLNGGDDPSNGESHADSFSEFNLVGATEPTGNGHFAFDTNDYLIRISEDRRTLHLISRISDSVSNNNNFDDLWVLTAVTIPEPSTLSLAMLGLCGLGLRRRRRG